MSRYNQSPSGEIDLIRTTVVPSKSAQFFGRLTDIMEEGKVRLPQGVRSPAEIRPT